MSRHIFQNMRIKGIDIPEDVERILSALHKADYAAYLVGGCVRDCMMAQEPHDWDICTSASPAQVKQIFNEKPYTVVPAGAKHGTVMVIAHGKPYEITVFRKKKDFVPNAAGRNQEIPVDTRFVPVAFSGRGSIPSGSFVPEEQSLSQGSTKAEEANPMHPGALEAEQVQDGVSGRFFCHTFLDNPLYEDLGLRDFTVNSMAWSPEEGLIDPYHGERDLAAGLLRCAGSAQERLSEDPLRILRALRFSAHLGFSIDPELRSAIHELYSLLKGVAVERITSELYRFMQAPGVRVAEMLRDYSDVACFVMPELKPLIGFDQHNHHHVYDVWEHTLKAMEACPGDDIVLKFTILFHDMGKPHTFTMDNQGVGHFYGHAEVSSRLCKAIMNRLRFDGKTEEEVVTLVEVHDARVEGTTRSIRRWLNRIGEEQFRRLLQMKRCDAAGQNPVYWPEREAYIDSLEKAFAEVLAQDACFSMKDLAVKGSDLIAVGYERGKVLGKCLKRLLDEVIDERLPNDKKVLLSQAVFWLHQEYRGKE